ncbi:MAG: Ig-like domain-containing protein, partial [Planctomycetota bacterium]
PIPIGTAELGTLQQVFDAGQLVALRYRPRANFTGTDSFIFTVTDDGVSVLPGSGGMATNDPRLASANVSIDVLPVNDAPQFGGAGGVSSDEDAGPISIADWATNVQAGPTSADDEINGTTEEAAQELTFQIVQVSGDANLFSVEPMATISNGSATLNYTSAPNANGQAVFEVTLSDSGPSDPQGDGSVNVSDTRTFTVTIDAVNDVPTFTPGGDVVINEDSGLFTTTWATNIEPGPVDEAVQSVRFEVDVPEASRPLFQTLPTIDENGVLQFLTAADANGTALVSVRAIDSEGGEAQAVQLAIVINEVNDRPVTGDDEFAPNEDEVLRITQDQLLANDNDVDLVTNPNEALTLQLQSGTTARGATIVIDPATGDIVYDPTSVESLQALAPGQSQLDSFSYTLTDAAGLVSRPALVRLNVEGRNDAPTLVVDSPTLQPTGSTIIRPLLNDFDIDGTIDITSVQIESQPAFGTASVRDDGSIEYIPFGSFSGEDVFTYTVADNLGLRSEAQTIRVGANTPPEASDDAAQMFVGESAVDVDVLANDVDNDGELDPASVTIVTAPGRGTATPLANGQIRYVPEDEFVGTDSFTYTVSDASGRVSNTATVQVQVLASPGQNPALNSDVNDDGFVTPIDALLVINKLNRDLQPGQDRIPVDPDAPRPNYFDVSGDQFISPIDALQVINALNRIGPSAGEGELVAPPTENSAAETGSVDPVTQVVEELGPAAKLVGGAAAPLLDATVIESIAEAESSDDGTVEALDAALAKLI